MRSIQNSSRLIVLALVIISAFGCQSKKKAMQASNAAAEKAKIEREAADRKMQEQQDAQMVADEKAKREAEQRSKEKERENNMANSPTVKLDKYFSAISGASNVTSANTSINEALTLFASPETPVFIVISESGGVKDYDKPTTIKNYLNYLKDQKKNINSISNLKTDANGKVTELELKKN